MDWDTILGSAAVLGALSTVVWLYVRSVHIIETIHERNLRTARQIKKELAGSNNDGKRT